jgi:hypothetical protein
LALPAVGVATFIGENQRQFGDKIIRKGRLHVQDILSRRTGAACVGSAGGCKRRECQGSPFYTETLKNKYGIIKEVTFTPIDQLGIKFDDILRMINTDVFDVANIGIANVAKDYPILEGIDISGAFPSFSGVRQVLDDVRFDFDQRLQEKFKVKLLTLWPFGRRKKDPGLHAFPIRASCAVGGHCGYDPGQ